MLGTSPSISRNTFFPIGVLKYSQNTKFKCFFTRFHHNHDFIFELNCVKHTKLFTNFNILLEYMQKCICCIWQTKSSLLCTLFCLNSNQTLDLCMMSTFAN